LTCISNLDGFWALIGQEHQGEDPMRKLCMTGFGFAVAMMSAGSILTSHTSFAAPRPLLAQNDGQDAAESQRESAGLLRENNITGTGATVPHPGVSQGAGPTPLDHAIERQNDKIDNSICKGC
jgi:hypothetical protein